MQPKLLDVARHAGVSPATVSRVLNNTAPVHVETRARVLAAIATLGYKPALDRGDGQVAPTQGAMIALLITDILNPFFSELIRGIEDEIGHSDLALLVCHTTGDPQRERQTLRMLAKRQVDGIVACASRLDTQNLISFYERHKTPLVIVNRRIEHPHISCITADFESGTYRATQHLLSHNHERIAYLAGPGTFEGAMTRRRGIETALAEANQHLRSGWCPTGFPNVEGGFQAMSALLTLPADDRPTAVIAYNDMMALGALQAVRAQRLHVPDDISVVGCDDIAMAAHANPPLTTIAQPKYRIGRLAIQLWHQMSQGQFSPSNGYTLLESPLIIRESTGPLAASRRRG
jgi:DNA-binding LacI/PurR family transcriptional regulator